jgi:hypothetical protein
MGASDAVVFAPEAHNVSAMKARLEVFLYVVCMQFACMAPEGKEQKICTARRSESSLGLFFA